MIAMMIQPMESSQIAEATMICPRLRRVKPISRTIAATILIEEIESAVPRNSDVRKRWSGCGSSDSGMNWPSAKPQTNGTATPVSEMLSAALPTLAHQPEIGLHPGEQKQQQDAELRDAVEHGLLLGGLGKERVLEIGQQRAEHRRTKQNPAEQHPHDRGLTDTVHGLAQEPSDQHQRDQLREEDDLGGAALGAFGRESRAGQEGEPGERHRRPPRRNPGGRT